LFHFSVNTTIVPDLKQQKKLYVEELKNRLKASLKALQKSIGNLCDSWTVWEEMNTYMEKPSEKFENEYLTNFSFLGHRLNVILILAPDGKILFNRNYNIHAKFIAFNRLGIGDAVDKIKKTIKETQHSYRGIVNSRFGPLLVAANPVRNGGILILGRFMDRKLLEKVSFHFTETVQPIPLKDKWSFSFNLKQMQGDDFHFQEDKTKITLLYLVKDIEGAPSIIFKIEADNKLFRMVSDHTFLYILSSVLSMLMLGSLVYFLIEKYINKRIIEISDGMKNVQGLKDISTRIIPDTKGDEISALILEINNMMNKVEQEKEDRQNIEQILVTNEKLVCIGRLTASIAHEINNPILVIGNCLQAIKNTCIGSSEIHKEAIAVSKKEIDRVRNIIASLLDFHRLDREDFSDVNLNEVVLQALEFIKWSKKLDSIKIITKKKQNFFLFGSLGKLQPVFLNFVLNAAEANTGKKGILRIEILPSKNN
ncbi:MAG: hypothetical protein GY950_17360, partial [bacterium]|nr:hypothetical protein [bacterium]